MGEKKKRSRPSAASVGAGEGENGLKPEGVDLGTLELASDEEGLEEASDSSESGLEEDISSISGGGGSSISDGNVEEDCGDDGSDDDDDGENLAGASKDAEEGSEQLVEDPGSDSSEDERPNRNTVGNVPLEWYKHEDHIGYDLSGKRLEKKDRKDRLDQLLDRMDNDGLVTTIYDEYNDEDVKISREELKMLMRIRQGRFPDVNVDPHWMPEPWFTSKPRIHPLIDRPKPKSSFIPSKHEERIVLRLVRAIRKGLLKQKKPKTKPSVYMMWDDDASTGQRTGAGLSYMPAPKKDLPGHADSYRPPEEYLPTEEERQDMEADNELREGTEDNQLFIPKSFAALRKVPAYERFINELFERCLDLYLCPRARRKKPREKLTSESFIPKLPTPKDLQPFPTMLCIKYEGHTGKVRSVAPDSSGQWLASGGDDGALKVWEVRTGRCLHTWKLGTPVISVSWCPHPTLKIISAAAGKRVLLLPAEIGNKETREAARKVLTLPNAAFREEINQQVSWEQREEGFGLEIKHSFLVKYVSWHCQGDYFASVCPDGNTKAVMVHRLSKKASQNPFRKPKGKIIRVIFHPFKPVLFVQSQTHVRVYNLSKQVLIKRLAGSRGIMTSMAVHSTGDHVIVGGDDERLCWFDLDLSTRPYKTLKYHKQPIKAVAYHKAYPLFASASDDGTVQIFHGMVYNDLLTNALIVPLKILKGHSITDFQGVLDCAFHPTQPWIFTAGADSAIYLFCN